MKCLKNLSLVRDECLEDLQNDIEKLIESYIDIEKENVRLFKEARKDLRVWNIQRIAEIFFHTETFWDGVPINIHQSGWEEKMMEFLCFESKDDIKDSLKEIMNMFERYSLNDARDFDIENGSYWLYRDVNGELQLEAEDYFLDTIEKIIPYECIEIQIELYKLLRRILNK